jgi:chemotaxis protein CheZ
MISLEPQDWKELEGHLKETEESLAALSAGDSQKEMERSRRSIVSFHTTAAMLGLEDLEKAGLEFEKYLAGNVSPDSMDSIAALGFAISSVIDQLHAFSNGNGQNTKLDLNEILEVLSPMETNSCPPAVDEPIPEPVPAGSMSVGEADSESLDEDAPENFDFTKLGELVRSLGGELSVDPEGDPGAKFSLTFTGSADSLKKIERLLNGRGDSMDPDAGASEDVIENLFAKSREFVNAFSSGDMDEAQRILLKLADQQNVSSGLYKEIGGLARGLHDSIRGFVSTLDPSLNEIVKDKIPDSGNRLEHILEMTEKAAITTMDLVENIQERLAGQAERVSRLRGTFAGLHPIGDGAGKKLDEAAQSLNDIETVIAQNRSDLNAILTAQDYQDLSGQIILKITQLLKDIESKLVNLIRTFGVKTESSKQKECAELYGPAHAGVENAVHSQDEVDSMLAEFGF